MPDSTKPVPRPGHDGRCVALRRQLEGLDSLAIAFSGGVDSSVLLHAAHAALGPRAVALVADSASLARRELSEARAVAELIGVRLVELATLEGQDPRYQANAGDRCFFCKHALFEAMQGYADEHGIAALAYGEISDDLADDRPGARAAREYQVIAPLSAAGFDKLDVRAYAARHGLPVAQKPASACLASRIPVGTRVTPERLAQVEAAEESLRALGFRELRVRQRGPVAAVELGEAEIEQGQRRSNEIRAALLALGYERVELGTYLPPARRVGGVRPPSLVL